MGESFAIFWFPVVSHSPTWKVPKQGVHLRASFPGVWIAAVPCVSMQYILPSCWVWRSWVGAQIDCWGIAALEGRTCSCLGLQALPRDFGGWFLWMVPMYYSSPGHVSLTVTNPSHLTCPFMFPFFSCCMSGSRRQACKEKKTDCADALQLDHIYRSRTMTHRVLLPAQEANPSVTTNKPVRQPCCKSDVWEAWVAISRDSPGHQQ